MENIETTVTASDCESPEWLGCHVDSENIVPSQIAYTVVSPRGVEMITTCVFGWGREDPELS